MKFLEEETIQGIRQTRADLEIRVAKKIGECIEQCCNGALHTAIQKLLEEICLIDSSREDPLKHYLDEKSRSFAMFLRQERPAPPTREGMEILKRNPYSLNLADCSDIIRLFGELAEDRKCQGLTGSKWSMHNKGKEKLKPFPTYLKPEDIMPAEGEKRDPTKKYKADWKDRNIGHRARIDLEKKKLPINRSEGPYVQIPQQINRGVDKFNFAEQSVMGALDRTFGLAIKGADVSGTTTDSMYALKYACEACSESQHYNLLMLLPIATMVPAGHHSLIECAYPLSRWNHIDYHVGYYDTLVPTKCAGGDKSVLASALSAFNAEADKIHVLVYRDAFGQQKGLQMEGKEEIDEFKRLAKVLSAYGWCLSSGLNEQLVANVMQSFRCEQLLKKYQKDRPQGRYRDLLIRQQWASGRPVPV